jgi:glycosyltransferase involved in cell wall biosynthesis
MLTIVIPALNAAERLGACLDSVRDADEIVVVDGGSTDDTVRIATEKGARMFRSDRGRGVQLHGGALAASGDWLLFLHGDTVLPPGWTRTSCSRARHQGRPSRLR